MSRNSCVLSWKRGQLQTSVPKWNNVINTHGDRKSGSQKGQRSLSLSRTRVNEIGPGRDTSVAFKPTDGHRASLVAGDRMVGRKISHDRPVKRCTDEIDTVWIDTI